MRKLVHFVVIFALVIFSTTTFYAPPAQAAGPSILIDYYDENVEPVGWHYRSCSGSISSEGAQFGVWKEVVSEGCQYPWNYSVQAYHFCGGQWVPVASIGQQGC